MEICPNETQKNDNDHLCKDIDLSSCKLSKEDYTYLKENLTKDEIELYAKKFAKEYSYTDNHISIFENEIISILIYKNDNCISELKLNPQVLYDKCYEELKGIYNIDKKLIIMLITNKKRFNSSPSISSYTIHDPIEGKILKIYDICKDIPIEVQEDLLKKIENTNVDVESIKYLTEQNIDVFNISSIFYTDICFHFNSPIDKDIALKDRISLYYPNITLCENGCNIKGVNLTSLKAICDCKLNNLLKNNFLQNNAIYKSSLGEVEELLSNTNLEVFKCYKDFFNSKKVFTSLGGPIIFSFLIIQIALTIIYFLNTLYLLKKYLFNITDKYLLYLSNQNNNAQNNFLLSKNYFKSEPIKRKGKKSSGKTRRNKRKAKTKIEIGRKASINSNKRNSISYKNKYYPEIKNYFVYNEFVNNLSDNKKLNSNELSPIFQSKGKISPNKFNNDDNILNKSENDIKEYLKTDLNDLDYDDAIKKDKRKFCEYFCEKLKNNQIILNTFCVIEPLRPRVIKIMLFILQIDLYLVVNGLFFNEEYVSQIFHSENTDNFSSIIQRSIDRFFYTTLVGVIVEYIVDFFFIEEKKIKKLFIREKENILIIKYGITQIIKSTSKRNKWFIILIFVIIFISFYYIVCFNNIYPHMRKEWIISSIIIIISRQILSIIICLLESIIRFIGFFCKSEKVYKFSLLFS